MNTKRFRRWIVRMVRITIIVIVLSEIALRVLVSTVIRANPVADSTPPSHFCRHEAYCDKAFQDDYSAANQGWTFDENSLPYHADYHGLYFNIVNSRRVTVGQPASAPHTLWLFGSSTIYGYGVPDGMTTASYLQRLVRPTYRVENMATQGVNAAQQTYQLKATEIKPGDIVIFYDGVNDAFALKQVTLNRRRLQPTLCHILLSRVAWSFIVQTLCYNVDNAPVALDDGLIHQIHEDYERAIVEAHDYALQHGARFYHILQPLVFSMPGEYDKESTELYAVAWPLYQGTRYTVDFTHSLDTLRSQSAGVYIDQMHLTPFGNEVIARAIADVIEPTL